MNDFNLSNSLKDMVNYLSSPIFDNRESLKEGTQKYLEHTINP